MRGEGSFLTRLRIATGLTFLLFFASNNCDSRLGVFLVGNFTDLSQSEIASTPVLKNVNGGFPCIMKIENSRNNIKIALPPVGSVRQFVIPAAMT